MKMKRHAAAACLPILVVALSACSTSTKEAAPTTTAALPATTTRPATTVARPHVAVTYGCTTGFPRQFLNKLNAGVAGIGTKLVPIQAVNVRVCRYDGHGQLVGAGKFPPAAVAAFLAETNRLPKQAPTNCSGGNFSRYFFLTFSDGTKKTVSLGEHDGCGAGAGNGSLVVSENAKWANEVIANS
jgi:hypothetical protein